MFFFDLPLFALLNADLQTPVWCIEIARLCSRWLPNLTGVAIALGLAFGPPAMRRTLVMLLCSAALAWCIARLIRWGFPAPRPFQLEVGMRWLDHGGRSSFPSMHACGAFAVAQALALGYTRRFRWLVALMWGAALAVCWSRVHLGLHFPSDVIAGAAIGCLSAWCVWQLWCAVAQRWERRRQAAAAPLPTAPALTPEP